MKIQFLKDTKGIYNTVYQKNDIISYHPWYYEWQGMSEPERINKGIFIHCHGHGEFVMFKKGIDVRIIYD